MKLNRLEIAKSSRTQDGAFLGKPNMTGNESQPDGIGFVTRDNPVYRQMAYVRYHTVVPAHTEAKIHQLCTEALAANAEADVERVIPKPRAALQEHVRLAKSSLEGQVSTIALLDTSQSDRGVKEQLFGFRKNVDGGNSGYEFV